MTTTEQQAVEEAEELEDQVIEDEFQTFIKFLKYQKKERKVK